MLQHFALEPTYVESLKQVLQADGWQVCQQDAGQTHLLGWGYSLVWEKDSQRIELHYSEKQGKAEANLLVSEQACQTIETLLKSL